MDKPATDAELDQFYGTEATHEEIQMTIGAAAAEVDADVMSEIARENFDAIADAVVDSPYTVGTVLLHARRVWIANQASKALYGREGVITFKDVHV